MYEYIHSKWNAHVRALVVTGSRMSYAHIYLGNMRILHIPTFLRLWNRVKWPNNNLPHDTQSARMRARLCVAWHPFKWICPRVYWGRILSLFAWALGAPAFTFSRPNRRCPRKKTPLTCKYNPYPFCVCVSSSRLTLGWLALFDAGASTTSDVGGHKFS